MSERTVLNESQLRVGAHVLIQLGRELVTDIEQALLELVKNAYDADSPNCEIVIEPDFKDSIRHQDTREKLVPFCDDAENVNASYVELHDGDEPVRATDLIERVLSYTGRIIVRDRGVGLSPEAVKNSWLVVSNSVKREEQGKPKKQTKKGRTPLGDKGLGRLGTMRLGDILMLRSAQKGANVISEAWFRWKDCEGAETLDRIPVQTEVRPNADNFSGTEVIVLGLNDISEWKDKDRAKEISYSIASIVSPFEATKTFPVSVRIDGLGYDLQQITKDITKQAASDFKFEFLVDDEGDGILKCTAQFRQSIFTASSDAEAVRRAEAVMAKDGGRPFLSYLGGGLGPNGEDGSRRLNKYATKQLGGAGEWFIELTDTIPFSKIVKGMRASVANPGPFSGTFYYFNFSRGTSTGQAATREQLKRLKGIAILRDGFRVRAGEDWLNLSRSMTSGSTYHLRVVNTAGYFALSGEKNFRLTEKSDREGFVQDPHFRGFLAIAERSRDFANKAQEDVRRGLNDYLKLIERDDVDASEMTSGQAVKAIRGSAKSINAATKSASVSLGEQKQMKAALEADGDNVDPEERARKALQLASTGIETIEKLTRDVADMRNLAAASTIVIQQIELQSEQVAALVDSAAVGLSARSLTHEMHTHLGEIERATHNVRTMLKNTEYAGETSSHLRAIDLARRTLMGAANQIDPMLPRTRAVKEKLSLASFCERYFEARQYELEKEGVTATVVKDHDPIILINRNRLLQVMDNLANNSRYWLQDSSSPKTGERAIKVKLQPAGFIFEDNGAGVDPKYEDELFDIFVTAKPQDGRGQGLGLYIVTQLLALDGGSIRLLPDRNSQNNRYKFEVDLSSSLVQSDSK